MSHQIIATDADLGVHQGPDADADLLQRDEFHISVERIAPFTQCDESGPGWLNYLVDLGPAIMAKWIPDYLGRMPGIPEALAAESRKPWNDAATARQVELGRKLMEAASADRQEPSLAAVGHLLKEIAFAHVWRRADFMANKLSVPVEDYLEETKPLIADHPLRKVVEATGRMKMSELEAFVAQDLPKADLSPATVKFYLQLRKKGLTSQPMWSYFNQSEDTTTWDFERRLDQSLWGKLTVGAVATTLSLSPYSIAALASQIETDWPAAQARRADWEPRLSRHPMVARALAYHHMALKEYADAEKYGRIWADGSPDYVAYHFLARVYDEQNKLDQWRATLDEFLDKGISPGLQSVNVSILIANRLMKAGKFQEAWPYAERAADSGAALGQMCAQRCAEGLGNWKQAEEYVRANSLRYDSRAENWYLWCKRLGRGDIGAARPLALKYIENEDEPDRPLVVVGMAMLEGDESKALAELEKRFPTSTDPWDGLHLALLYDAAGRLEERNRILTATIAIKLPPDTTSAGRLQMIRQAEWFQRCIRENSTESLSIDAVKGFMQSVPGEESNLCYFFGRFAELRGKAADAKKLYAMSIWSENPRMVNMALSGWRLKSLGVDPVSTKPEIAAP